MLMLRKLIARKAKLNKITLFVGAVLGSLGTLLVMKLLGRVKCSCCFKRILGKKK